jgi:hypothetical protein
MIGFLIYSGGLADASVKLLSVILVLQLMLTGKGINPKA